MAEYTNRNINRASDIGDQQISIRPYDSVTSLNVNQLLAGTVDQGAANLQVSFANEGQNNIRITVAEGSYAFFEDYYNFSLEEGTQDRTYAVRVGFESDATIDVDFVNFTIGLPNTYRNEDYGASVDQPSGNRMYLILQYNWEEGMLSSAAEVGGGTGTGNVGRYAALSVTNINPHAFDPTNFRKTIYLGEVLNIAEAIIPSGGSDYDVWPNRLHFRPQVIHIGMLKLFDKLRAANAGFHTSFNPTGDFVYVGAGEAFIGSNRVVIPKGFRRRVPVITPDSLISANPLVQPPVSTGDPRFVRQLYFSESTGQPTDAYGDPLTTASDILGQYDVLAMDRSGSTKWLVRAMTAETEAQRTEAAAFIENEAMYSELRPASQQATQAPEDLLDLQIDDTYLILLIVRRIYVQDGGVLKLHNKVWPADYTIADWVIYEHNPFNPLIPVSEMQRELHVSQEFTLPLEEE